MTMLIIMAVSTSFTESKIYVTYVKKSGICKFNVFQWHTGPFQRKRGVPLP